MLKYKLSNESHLSKMIMSVKVMTYASRLLDLKKGIIYKVNKS